MFLLELTILRSVLLYSFINFSMVLCTNMPRDKTKQFLCKFHVLITIHGRCHADVPYDLKSMKLPLKLALGCHMELDALTPESLN